MFTHPAIRSTFSSVGEPDHVVMLTLGMLLRNMIPLVVICVLLALGLKFFPNGMVKGFMVFGKLMTGALTLVVVACILQHYTGLFTDILASAGALIRSWPTRRTPSGPWSCWAPSP